MRAELLCPALARVLYPKLIGPVFNHYRPCPLHDFHHVRHFAAAMPNAMRINRLRHDRAIIPDPEMSAARLNLAQNFLKRVPAWIAPFKARFNVRNSLL